MGKRLCTCGMGDEIEIPWHAVGCAVRHQVITKPSALSEQVGGDRDPNGIDQHKPGAKLDAGKLRAALVLGGFAKALSMVAEVGTYGAEKYSPNGWKSVPNGADRYADALVRHALAYASGEKYDAESGLPHLSHAAWNLLAFLELTEGEQ